MNTAAVRSEHLRHGLHGVGWNNIDLWLASVALGGNLSLQAVTDLTTGIRDTGRHDYELLAAALNDMYNEMGQDHPVPRWDAID